MRGWRKGEGYYPEISLQKEGQGGKAERERVENQSLTRNTKHEIHTG